LDLLNPQSPEHPPGRGRGQAQGNPLRLVVELLDTFFMVVDSPDCRTEGHQIVRPFVGEHEIGRQDRAGELQEGRCRGSR